MFDSLSERLQTIFNKLRSHGTLNEKQIEQVLREVRLSLLEADVHFNVVKEFTDKIKKRALGAEVMESLTPAQQVIKIVHDEIAEMMGSTQSKVLIASRPPTRLTLVGLQGSGKTTAVAKLANYFKKEGRNTLLIAADTYRPAAIEQLQFLGQEINIPVFSLKNQNPLEISIRGMKEAEAKGYDIAVLDTAGRLHIDEVMMNELIRIKDSIKPHEIMLVVDAMTGQDAVNLALAFQERINFDSLILTKLDGDARGGAALSIKQVTGKPIKFVSLGEKIEDFEPFHPERMASRILGMGDVLTLIEKAQEGLDEKKAREMEKKLLKQQFNFNDFLDQLQQIKKMGDLSGIMEMIPGFSQLKKTKNLSLDERQLSRIEAIIQSMTLEERARPSIINGSRRKRISQGSGTSVSEVNQMVNQFFQMQKLVKQMSTFKGKMKLPRHLFPMG